MITFKIIQKPVVYKAFTKKDAYLCIFFKYKGENRK